ncbi:MAG: CHASE2 domain-containing protein, partial [Bdellovibrionota bacterium]
MMKWFKLSGFKVAMALTLGMMALFFLDELQDAPITEFFRLVEYKAYDIRFKARGTKPAGTDVVIVAIDEKSVEELGRWPWKRALIGQAFDNLRKDGAAVVANDIVYAEPDPNDHAIAQISQLVTRYEETGLKDVKVMPQSFDQSYEDIISRLSDSKNNLAKQKVIQLANDLAQSQAAINQQSNTFYEALREQATGGNDTAFAEAIRQFPGLVLGYFFYMDEIEVEGLKKESYQGGEEFIAPSKIQSVILREEVEETEPFQTLRNAIGLERNIEPLSKAAKHFGYFNAEQDLDGVIRRTQLVGRYNDGLYPSLTLEAIRA